MEFKAKSRLLKNFDRAIQYEWLEANGVGGWASSTICGANSRRYHGLLVAALNPPGNRMVLLSRLDETVQFGPLRFELGCNKFPTLIHPQGHWRLKSFRYDLFPEFTYQIAETVIKKTVAAVHGENTTLVLYEIEGDTEPFSMQLQPFVAARDYHSLAVANETISRSLEFNDGVLSVQPYPEGPKLFISVPAAAFDKHIGWHYCFEYPQEKARGLNHQEDLFCYGQFKMALKKGDHLGIVISTEPVAGRNAFHLFEEERKRRLALAAAAPRQDEFMQDLAIAADQFVVKTETGDASIIAGYPWFVDWGRDAFIALPGLCLVTKRFDDAKAIIRRFCRSVRDGIVPNCFGEKPPATINYNSVDAGLWLFVALHKLLQYTRDYDFVNDVALGTLRDIVAHYRKGTNYRIRAGADGLLSAGDRFTPLTWMDAKYGHTAFTPRNGKAVEINALWHNALAILASICGNLSLGKEAAAYADEAGKVKDAFQASFWNEAQGSLYDVIEGRRHDETIRPNQIFAVSLPYPLLDKDKAAKVISCVEPQLLTPFGLRTLPSSHPEYRREYSGDQPSRDSAYHQGTVWPWLFGHYATAVARYGNEEQKGRIKVTYDTLRFHLQDAGLGSISEIFDGDYPHQPRGCSFQAWSVAEVFRSYVEDYCGIVP